MLNITKKDVVAIGSIIFGISGFAYGYNCDKRIRAWIRMCHSKNDVKYVSNYDKKWHQVYQTGESSNKVQKIKFDNLCDAKKILADMQNYIKNYHEASIADYYQLLGFSCNEMHFLFGWHDLKNTKITYDNSIHGYVIDFPKVVPLE